MPSAFEQLRNIASRVKDYTGLHVETSPLLVLVTSPDAYRLKCFTPYEHPGGERTVVGQFLLRWNLTHQRWNLSRDCCAHPELQSLISHAMVVYYDEIDHG